MDYTNVFTTDAIHPSREALIEWVRETGKRNGMVIIIQRADIGATNRSRPRITFVCERSGAYRHTGMDKGEEGKKKRKRKATGTKKCGCPFSLRGIKLPLADEWTLVVKCGTHNHPGGQHVEGHSFAGRLSMEEIGILIDLSKSQMKPKEILNTLKERDGLNCTTIKGIYNARHKHKLNENAGGSLMQQLMNKLMEFKYIEWHRNDEHNNCVRDLMFAHPSSLELLRAFPRVLIMDCTYRTNKYQLPLLEVVGVTSTEKTFSVAFAYLGSEREEAHTWALERLRSMIDDAMLPRVVMTDREPSLMNALQKVFPMASNLLCRWHISTNILANCKIFFESKSRLDAFISMWNIVVLAETEDEYANRLNQLESHFHRYIQAINYCKEQWLLPYKEKFVAVWTNKVMHFGNTTVNRAESTRAKLKRQLGLSRGDIESSWPKIHSLLELQHIDIKTSFEISLTNVQHNFKDPLYGEVRGSVSKSALCILVDEANRSESIGVDASACGCVYSRTHGLPCAHEISSYKIRGQPIPLACVDPHWRKLDLVSVSGKKVQDVSFTTAMELFYKRFMDADDIGKQQLVMKLMELVNSTSTSLVAPKENVKTKEGCTSSFPEGLQPYIMHVKDVAADGNCGFRVIASAMGMGEEGWPQVRRDMLFELRTYWAEYAQLFRDPIRVDELIHVLEHFQSPADYDRWMTMPDMGHIIASRYNVVLVYISMQLCLTFLPLRSAPTPLPMRRVLSIGFINDNHFVEVMFII